MDDTHVEQDTEGTEPVAEVTSRQWRRPVVVAGTVAAVGLAAMGAKAVTASDAAEPVAVEVTRNTAPVSVRALESSEEISGTVLLGDVTSVSATTSGTVLDVVELGDELVAGDVIVRVVTESDDQAVLSARQKITSAQASLTSARESLNDLTSAADRGELAGLESSLLQAERNFQALFEPATDAAIDSARGRLLLAEQALERLQDGPSELDLLQAEARILRAEEAIADLDEPASEGEIDAAEANVLQAQERLDALQEPPTDAEIASANARVSTAEQRYADASEQRSEAIAQAEADLAAAQDDLDDATATRDQAGSDATAAQSDYCASATHDVDAACSTLPLASTVRTDLQTEINDKTAADPSDPDIALGQALLDRDSEYASAIADVTAAQQVVNDAYAALQDAQNTAEVNQAYADLLAAREARAALDEGPSDAELASAQAQVQQAREALARLQEGPTRSQLVSAQAELLASKEAYEDLTADATEADLLLARADIADAQTTLDALLEGPDETDIEIAKRSVETAQLRIEDALAGPSAGQLAQQRAQVSAASLNVELAESELAAALEGGRTTVLMTGSVPAYRTMSAGDVGEDVFQLERNLESLGFEPGTVDGTFDDDTAGAVRQWQASLDLDPTGEVALGAVTFAIGDVRVASLGSGVGIGVTVGPGTPLVDLVPVTEISAEGDEVPTQRVVATLDVDDRSLLELGDEVGIELPDDTDLTGVVTDVRLVAETNNQGVTTTSIEVEVRPDTEIDDLWTDATVTVSIVTSVADADLAVPVTALLALAEGGYAIEVLADDGSFQLVGVDIGEFSDGYVQIRGDELREGMQVAVAQ